MSASRPPSTTNTASTGPPGRDAPAYLYANTHKVPLTFALFLAFLCEPLLAFMVTAQGQVQEDASASGSLGPAQVCGQKDAALHGTPFR